MTEIEQFTFNAFQENTYLLIDPTSKQCIIVDPGCNSKAEQQQLTDYITEEGLTPIRLINTHCHIDHVLGNRLATTQYNLELEAHQLEVPVLASCEKVAQMYGIAYDPSPTIAKFIEEDDTITLGTAEIRIALTPGHSPGSICLICEDEKWVIGGDVLFFGSIGRTDLPGGDYDTLMGSIIAKLMVLSDDVMIHPGHGPATTVGHERTNNPFIQGY